MAEVSLPGTTALSLDGPSGAYRIFLSVPAAPPPPEGFPLLILLDANLCFGTVSDLLRQGGFRPGVSRLCPAVVAGIDPKRLLTTLVDPVVLGPSMRWRAGIGLCRRRSG